MTAGAVPARSPWSLAPKSFRAKFVLVVGGALLFDLLMSGGLTLWNVQRLSYNAIHEVGQGLEKASTEYLEHYVTTTAERTDTLFTRYFSEVNTVAASMQAVIDNPALQASLGTTLEASPGTTTLLQYHPPTGQGGNWWQNGPGEASAVTVWGYLLDSQKQPLSSAAQAVRDSAVFDLFGPAIMQSGPPKLQMYYMGPQAAPILRSTPYNDQGAVFDRVYPGHNKTNWWDFFFPDLYPTFQSWIKAPASRPVDSPIVMLSPYRDGVTGKTIVSFFQPLLTPDRKDVDGVVGVDLTLDQMAQIIETVKIADTGFAFLAQSNGNVLAVTPAGQRTLGITTDSSGFSRLLSGSNQPGIAKLNLPADGTPLMRHVALEQNGRAVPYVVVMKRLSPTNLYSGKGPVTADALSLGLMVPEGEIYASLTAAQAEISDSARGIIALQIGAVLLSLLLTLGAVYAISGRITAGLSALADAARRLQNKDYSVRVTVPTRDEVGAVGVAFNRMAEEIRFHTENLETLVDKRTQDLHKANEEIRALNSRLTNENLRLGAELDVARQIQMMVLPKPSDYSAIPNLEIAGYMAPADEVGGDYFDVLHSGTSIKFGIGDVTGHGLESGVLMLMVQSVALALQEKGDDDPKSFLEVLNRAIYRNVERTRTDKHLSLAFLDYHPGKVTIAGQHEEVLIVRADGRAERVDTMDLGFPIGLQSDISPFVSTIDLEFLSGDTIILYTDGITEAESENGVLFGLEQLEESAVRHRNGNAETVKNSIIADVMAHIGTQTIHDDITLVVLRHR
ncbi:MAG TPA: SpoIIE family protein phosphatase [Devosiaceae bacterium]|nr:SpoIIE family protein phosphatase [Devosiaceae bacterium]